MRTMMMLTVLKILRVRRVILSAYAAPNIYSHKKPFPCGAKATVWCSGKTSQKSIIGFRCGVQGGSNTGKKLKFLRSIVKNSAGT